MPFIVRHRYPHTHCVRILKLFFSLSFSLPIDISITLLGVYHSIYYCLLPAFYL